MGIASDPQQALEGQGVDLSRDIWIWKPALSPAAARTGLNFFTRRYQVHAAEAEDGVGAAH